ncbi:hypothetical protein [Thalassotalea ganghwensis]
MELDFSEVAYLRDPDKLALKADYQQFLLSLSTMTVIDVTGKETNKWRVIATLLHGNEPSGLIALHRWLTNKDSFSIPQTNIRFIICSVEAASKFPLFSHRYLPDGLDINRCFNNDSNQGYFLRANIIKKLIREVSPELVIDMHNTSGSSPAFAVSPVITPEILALSAFFCKTIILSGIQLGALMEQNFGCPIVTIECGGAQDEQAHEAAFQGICQLLECEDIHRCHPKPILDIVYQPLRLKIKPNVDLWFVAHDEGETGVSLLKNIEQFNFGNIYKDQMLGWLDDKGLANLTLRNANNEDVINEFFTLRDNQLICRKDMKIFMATTKKEIATNDCLFYLVEVNQT